MMSRSDPDAACVRQGSGQSRPRYKHHRVIDDAKGVITATETTPGSIAENKKLMELVDQHEQNTGCRAQIIVADHKYGTSENFVACQQRGITSHMGDALGKAQQAREKSVFGDEVFTYDPSRDVVRQGKSSNPDASIAFAARWNTSHPPEFVVLVSCAPSALALLMGEPYNDTKNKRPWM